ncbi:probable elongator complex protein 2 [Cotesia glomerata]|uniref:Elongator complex protein 2 n=1 Tax=Cotesia glomerata TaxID=32391 RepID=A0AAV7HWP9_COTGL|nr:probable elongator complex protein 2 [Cotesia glomerata]KAH0549453.1 hypothetical protein KQX54_009413 [Cotesia glomerata]
MKVITNYISCASNCQPHAIDWCRNNNIICYASSNSVIIYDPDYLETGRVIDKLEKHESQVKVVEWICENNSDDCSAPKILSASLDGKIIIWSEFVTKHYKPHIIVSLDSDLSTAHAAYWPNSNSSTSKNNHLLIAGSSFKGEFKIWYHQSLTLIHQELDLKKKIPNEIKISSLPGEKSIPMIIMGLDDATIHLYTCNPSSLNKNIPELNFNHTIELRGHQDWIQCLDIVKYNSNEAFMASGSQDGTIRLWKISSIPPEAVDEEQRYQFKVDNDNFDISLESVLTGHDHWVNGVHWLPDNKNPLKLLSSGLDQTIIIWEPSPSGVWIETVKLGKVGGNSLGFYGCKFNSDGSSVLAQGYQGTFHLWRYNEEIKKWYPRSGPTGHFSEVTDLHWEPRGRYLLTTSLDQTTRIHVPWPCKKSSSSSNWHEIARPQIHGYDINCLTILNSTMFCSGADEKVIRVFKAPAGFSEALSAEDWSKALNMTDSSASVPALGLTNKTSQEQHQYLNTSDINEHDNNDGNFIKRPPTEEEIIRYTLWPELEKLYGHGYELFSIAARSDGKLIATACKSTSPEHSAIILWSTETWAQIGKLMSHRLTVTQLEFSPDGKYLLSVSRDRRWSLFEADSSGDNLSYNLVACSPAKSLHTRIIWCCSWSHDSKYFATGSRDGKVGLWKVDQLENDQNILPVESLEFPDASVTALDFYNDFIDDSYVLAIGFEDGTIQLQTIPQNFLDRKMYNIESEWVCWIKLDNTEAHHKTVKRLAFRPTIKNNNCDIELASCGADKAVKIYNFHLL